MEQVRMPSVIIPSLGKSQGSGAIFVAMILATCLASGTVVPGGRRSTKTSRATSSIRGFSVR